MIVVDTGPLLAIVDANDSHHAACVRWYETVNPRNLLVPAPVIAEACYLIGRYGGPTAEGIFLDTLASGELGVVTAIMPEDLTRMAALVRQYGNLPLGGTDACVVAIAERWQAKQVATVDRRHFTVVRPRHVTAFELLPADL